MPMLWRILLTATAWCLVRTPYPILASASVAGTNTSVGEKLQGDSQTASSTREQEQDVTTEEELPEVDVASEDKLPELEAEIAEEDEQEVEEAEEKVERREYGISLMLLGGIAFVMSLFIATNLEDDDMRFYVWKVISSTISILVAVMMFTCINDFMHKVVLKGKSHQWQILWDFAQCIIYNVAMQITVAVCVFAAEDAELKMRCWGQLMAHASGFAAIHFGACMQQGDLFPVAPRSFLSFMAPVVMAVALWLFFVVLRLSRSYIAHKFVFNEHDVSEREHHEYSSVPQEEPPAGQEELEQKPCRVEALHATASDCPLSSEDGHHRVPPLCPQGHPIVAKRKRGRATVFVAHETHQNWEGTIYEAENDVSALCVSFLAVQALRSNITGLMPDPMGNDHKATPHTIASIELVATCSLLFLILGLVMEIIASRVFTTDHLADMAKMSQGFSWRIFFFLLFKRCSLVGAQGSAMGTAWCLLCDSQWMLHRWFPQIGSPRSITFMLFLALMISAITFCIVWVLDKISDAEKLEDKGIERMIDRSIIKTIMALGIWVGFAWEHSFDRAVEVVVDLVPCPELLQDPVVLEMLGTTAISSLIVYSWRRYILQKVINLERLRELAEKATGRVSK